MPFKIAISGKMGSGKSTLAKTLKILCPTAKIISMAGKLKLVVNEVFNPEQKDRKLLTTIADLFKSIDQNVWVKCVDRETQISDHSWILDDLRYKYEYKYLKKKNWKTIRIIISPDIQLKRLKIKYKENYKTHLEHFNHSSEIDLDDIPYDEYDVVVIYTTSNKFMVISKNKILTQGTCKGDHYMLLIGISILRGIGLFTNLKDQ